MTVRLVAVSAGESATSKTRALAQAAIDLHGSGEMIDISALSADGLLGRVDADNVADSVSLAGGANILFVATPVYRATYTASLKAFFDRFPTDGLAFTTVILAATAAAPQHFLALDTGLRPLIASLSGWSVPTTVYAIGSDFVDGRPSEAIIETIRKALGEAARIAG